MLEVSKGEERSDQRTRANRLVPRFPLGDWRPALAANVTPIGGNRAASLPVTSRSLSWTLPEPCTSSDQIRHVRGANVLFSFF